MTARTYTQQELNDILWSAADSSRTSLDGGVYKDYALTMLFFKYLSDLSKKQYEGYRARFGDDAERIASKMKTERFYLPLEATFDHVYSKKEEDNIGEEINKALHIIEDINKTKLEGVFSVDFNSESTLGKL